MSKITIVYTPQCPSNLHFIRQIREWSKPYGASVDAINIFGEYKRAKKFIDLINAGYTKHMFIIVFVDSQWVHRHPGNPQFREEFLKTLEIMTK
jgi:hypothetical protein